MAQPQTQPPQPPSDDVHTLVLPDGRTLAYAVYGCISSPSGQSSTTNQQRPPTILYFHGFPGSRHEAAVFHGAAWRQGVRLVAPDRPGMGRSTFAPTRTILDWPRDVAALVEHLGVTDYAVIGTSAGTPYALACCLQQQQQQQPPPPAAAESGARSEGSSPGCSLPASPASSSSSEAEADAEAQQQGDDVKSSSSSNSRNGGVLCGVGLVGGLYPADLGLSGMMAGARALLWLAPWATGLVRTCLDWNMGAAARDAAHPERLVELLAQSFEGRPRCDRAIWEDDVKGFRGNLVASTREALRESAAGPAWEARLFGGEWGFGLGDVDVPRGGEGKGGLVMWHGGLDVNSPLRMAKEAHRLMPGSELRVSEDEGHCSLAVHRVDEVIETLKGMLV